MVTEIKLPNLGENIDSGDVLSILVSEGDQIEVEQGVLELETDKATVEVPSPTAGKVVQIHVSEGESVSVGAVILSLEPSGEIAPKAKKPKADAPDNAPSSETSKPAAPAAQPDPPPANKPVAVAPEAPAVAPEPTAATPTTSESDTPGNGYSSSAAGPAVRRLARELGVDLRRVRASGAGGRITKEDVQQHVRQSNQKAQAAATAAGPAPPGTLSTDSYGSIRRERMSRMRQTIAKNMVLSRTTIPQLTNFDDADVSELEKIRRDSKEDYERRGVKLTTMPFLVKAVASALKHHPVINASIDEETNEIIYKEYVNIGIAVDTDRGLLVPVMRDVDQMNFPQIAMKLKEIAESARSGDYSIEDLRGGTFSISNLGAIGGTYSTPIVNPPEVAILLAGRSRQMPVYVAGSVEARLMLPLSISYDHRIVDGAAAARFLNEVKDYLSAPGRLLLAP